MIDINFANKITKLQNTIHFWNRRNLTPLGKITVIKTLLLPLFTHLFISLPSPGEKILKQINTMFHNFVWDGPAKIKHSIAIQSFEEGGISMIDVYAFEKTMKLTWIRKIVFCTGKCFQLVYSIFDVKKMMNLGKDYAEKICKVIKNSFWKDVLACPIM